MEYLGYVISGIVLLVGIIFLIQGYKKYNTNLNQIILQKKDDIAAAVKEQQEEQSQLQMKLLAEKKELDNLIETNNKYRTLSKEAIDREIAAFHKQSIEKIQYVQETEFARIDEDVRKREEYARLLFQKERKEMDKQLQNQRTQIEEWQAKLDSIGAAVRRRKELEEKEDFYSIQVPQNDKDDIKVLQSMDLKLHNRNVIPKLIWELFIRRPTQEMTKRVTNGRECSGIYKVTNKQTGESYIGRSSNITTRWQNHVKTAIGLDAAAASTFHTRLAQDGVWDYTWEILEEVPAARLPEREAFYIELYGTKNQLNQKAGG